MQVYQLPRTQKMAKIAMYTQCQQNCICKGWRLPEDQRHKDVELDHCPNIYDICRNANCKHPLG